VVRASVGVVVSHWIELAETRSLAPVAHLRLNQYPLTVRYGRVQVISRFPSTTITLNTPI
jgi:hypothetical protein